jgi:hypothetical protein
MIVVINSNYWLHRTRRLVFLTEERCVLCSVWPVYVYLCIVPANFSFQDPREHQDGITDHWEERWCSRRLMCWVLLTDCFCRHFSVLIAETMSSRSNNRTALSHCLGVSAFMQAGRKEVSLTFRKTLLIRTETKRNETSGCLLQRVKACGFLKETAVF